MSVLRDPRKLRLGNTPPVVSVSLTEDPKDPRYGDLRVKDDQGGFLEGEVGTGPLIADRFKLPWPEHPLEVLLRPLDAPTAWIFKLKVPKESRNLGHGTKLLEAAIEVLEELGVRYIALSPRPESFEVREALWRFYERFGFERRGGYMVLDLRPG